MKNDLKDEINILRARDVLDHQQGSSFQKYANVFIGDGAFLSFLKYEIYQHLLSNMAGSMGLYLRQLYANYLFKNVGRKIVIGRGVSLRQPKKISMGNGCIVDEYSRLTVLGGRRSAIVFGDQVYFGPYSMCSCKDGYIEIGEKSRIGSHCRIGTMNGDVRLGSHVIVAAYSYIGGGNKNVEDVDIPMSERSVESKGVQIEDDVWIGANVFIMDGVRIGKGSIIGAYSLVNKDVPPFSIVYGIPGRVHGTRGA